MTRRKLLNIGNAGLRSEIKRLNERIASIGRRFGKDSEVYKATIAPLTSDKFKQYRGESKSGYFKLNIDLRNKDVQKDSAVIDMVRTAQGCVRSISELRKQAERDLRGREEKPGKQPTAAEITEAMEREKYYQLELSQVKEYIYEKYTEAEAKEHFPELYRGQTGDKPDYDVLDDIIARERDAVKEWWKSTHNYDL